MRFSSRLSYAFAPSLQIVAIILVLFTNINAKSICCVYLPSVLSFSVSFTSVQMPSNFNHVVYVAVAYAFLHRRVHHNADIHAYIFYWIFYYPSFWNSIKISTIKIRDAKQRNAFIRMKKQIESNDENRFAMRAHGYTHIRKKRNMHAKRTK